MQATSLWIKSLLHLFTTPRFRCFYCTISQTLRASPAEPGNLLLDFRVTRIGHVCQPGLTTCAFHDSGGIL